jgi:hypothetical protein
LDLKWIALFCRTQQKWAPSSASESQGEYRSESSFPSLSPGFDSVRAEFPLRLAGTDRAALRTPTKRELSQL